MKKIILTAVLAAAMCVAFAACGEEEAMQVQVTAGEETILEDGIYEGFTIDYDLSGSPDSPTIIRAAEGASPVNWNQAMESICAMHMTSFWKASRWKEAPTASSTRACRIRV